jgi:hypothetical protein
MAISLLNMLEVDKPHLMALMRSMIFKFWFRTNRLIYSLKPVINHGFFFIVSFNESLRPVLHFSLSDS